MHRRSGERESPGPEQAVRLRIMRNVLIIAMLLVARPAVAMNWEGHDDAFADDPYAKAFMQAAPHAKPLRQLRQQFEEVMSVPFVAEEVAALIAAAVK